MINKYCQLLFFPHKRSKRKEGDSHSLKVSMVFLRDNVSLQKLKQQHKSADDNLVDDEHSALEFAITVGKNEGLDVQFVKKKTNKNKNNSNNDGEMEWWVTKCICRVESTGETIELKMEESATIAMLRDETQNGDE